MPAPRSCRFPDLLAAQNGRFAPALAERMRPRTLDEMVGQQLLSAQRCCQNQEPGAQPMILWGPPVLQQEPPSRCCTAAACRRQIRGDLGGCPALPRVREVLARA